MTRYIRRFDDPEIMNQIIEEFGSLEGFGTVIREDGTNGVETRDFGLYQQILGRTKELTELRRSGVSRERLG